MSVAYSASMMGDQFSRLGHPGTYKNAYYYDGGSLAAGSGPTFFTGSLYGYGALMIIADGGAGLGMTASLSDGGTVTAGNLTAKTIYDFSIRSITGSGQAYAFKRQ